MLLGLRHKPCDVYSVNLTRRKIKRSVRLMSVGLNARNKKAYSVADTRLPSALGKFDNRPRRGAKQNRVDSNNLYGCFCLHSHRGFEKSGVKTACHDSLEAEVPQVQRMRARTVFFTVALLMDITSFAPAARNTDIAIVVPDAAKAIGTVGFAIPQGQRGDDQGWPRLFSRDPTPGGLRALFPGRELRRIVVVRCLARATAPATGTSARLFSS